MVYSTERNVCKHTLGREFKFTVSVELPNINSEEEKEKQQNIQYKNKKYI